MAKVIEVNARELKFDNGMSINSLHENDCCEDHWIDFKSVELKEFQGLEFDLDSDNFFERIKGYGIALLPINGLPIRIPGYGANNGYYSDNLSLDIYNNGKFIKSIDITECQEVES